MRNVILLSILLVLAALPIRGQTTDSDVAQSEWGITPSGELRMPMEFKSFLQSVGISNPSDVTGSLKSMMKKMSTTIVDILQGRTPSGCSSDDLLSLVAISGGFLTKSTMLRGLLVGGGALSYADNHDMIPKLDIPKVEPPKVTVPKEVVSDNSNLAKVRLLEKEEREEKIKASPSDVFHSIQFVED